MNTSQTLSQLYAILKKEFGSIQARQTVTSCVHNVISLMEDEGLEITPELFESRLNAYIDDFFEVAKKSNVA